MSLVKDTWVREGITIKKRIHLEKFPIRGGNLEIFIAWALTFVERHKPNLMPYMAQIYIAPPIHLLNG